MQHGLLKTNLWKREMAESSSEVKYKRKRNATLECFGEPLTLLEYLSPHVGLITQSDPPRFKKWLWKTLVLADQKPDLSLMDKPTSFGTSTHREVVMVAINKLLSSGKENVLTFGLFQYVKGNFDDSNIKSHNFSNNCGPVLKPVWKTLYNRIGENLMLHLLCRTSLFIPGGSKKCAYVQITGKPISGIKPTVVEYVLQKRRRIEKETGSDVKNPDSKDLKRKGCYEDVTPLKKFKHHLNDSKKKKEEEEKNHYIQQKKFKKHFLSEIKEKRWEELSKVTPSKPDDRCFLPIKICYNKSGVEKINSSSVLERPISQRSVRQLLTSIFFSGSKKKNKNKRIPKRYIKIEELLREFLKRHQ